MAKNRIIIENDHKLQTITATIASSTLETKSRSTILIKNSRIYFKSNSFTELIPIFIIFKAFGVEND